MKNVTIEYKSTTFREYTVEVDDDASIADAVELTDVLLENDDDVSSAWFENATVVGEVTGTPKKEEATPEKEETPRNPDLMGHEFPARKTADHEDIYIKYTPTLTLDCQYQFDNECTEHDGMNMVVLASDPSQDLEYEEIFMLSVDLTDFHDPDFFSNVPEEEDDA